MQRSLQRSLLQNGLGGSGGRGGGVWITYLDLILQLEVGAAVEAALALHSAYYGFAAIRPEVDSCHHLMHIGPVHHTLVWNVPHAHLPER